MSCSICIADYNKSTCAKVVCLCNFECCRSCAQTYLLSTIQEPHCMQCRNKWTLDFVKHNLGAAFVNGALKEHQTKIITEKSLSKREELMPLAIEYRISQNEKKRIKELREKMAVLREQLQLYQDEINIIEDEKRIRHGHEPWYTAREYRRRDQMAPIRETIRNQNIGGGGAAPETKKKFVMPCQNTFCNGMLNNNYCCELCDKKTCSKCLEIENEDHECNPDSVESAKLLRLSTKPCPKCGTRISKIDGCDQMWCIECKTSFSWNNGTIQNGYIHNPHYFEYMRKNNINIDRNPNDVRAGPNEVRDGGICGNIRDNALRFVNRYQTKDTNYKHRITDFIRYVNHVQGSTIHDLNNSIQTKTDNIQPLELRYIIGEISKEELSIKLMTNHKCILKDQAFKDIYMAVVMMGDQICSEITVNTTDTKYREILSRIMRFTAYFNMELIKALMLHDSKRMVEMFTDRENNDFTVSYKSKGEMTADLAKYKEIYESK